VIGHVSEARGQAIHVTSLRISKMEGEKMTNQGGSDLENTASINSKKSAWCRSRFVFSILSATLLLLSVLIGESTANETYMQESMKNRADKGRRTVTEPEQIGEFLPPYPFTKDELLQNIGKVLSSEDGRTTREIVERVFNVKFPAIPLKYLEKEYPNIRFNLLRPRLDWYLGMAVKNGASYSGFELSLDSTVCIHYKEFREVAMAAGWQLIAEAQFYQHDVPILRENFNKNVKGANLIVRLSKSDFNCIDEISMFNHS
jgi:hypothetical protein